MPGPQPDARTQLLALLNETGLSQRELAKRMTRNEGVAPEDFKQRWDSILRWVGKVTTTGKNRVHNPTPDRLEAIEEAADRPGYFTVPSRAQRRAAEATEMDDLRRRLAEVEDALNALGPELLDLSDLARRVKLLEQRATTRTRTSGTKQ